MSPKALVFYLLFLSSWFGGFLVVPFVALLAYFGFWAPCALLAAYTVARLLIPLREWVAFKAWTAFVAHDGERGGYFDCYDLVLDDGVTHEALATPGQRRLFGFHPHGILLCGWTMAIADARTHAWRARWLAARLLTVMPFVAEWMCWVGVRPVAQIRRLMARGDNIAMAVGGFEEATYYEYGRHKAFVRGRGGFVKFCLRHGYAIHPFYVFGEERTYRALTVGLRFRLLLNRLRIPGVLFFGRWWCPLMPDPTARITVVVGAPLNAGKPPVDAPTAAMVSAAHAAYVAALRSLFDKHKAKYAHEGQDAQLELIE